MSIDGVTLGVATGCEDCVVAEAWAGFGLGVPVTPLLAFAGLALRSASWAPGAEVGRAECAAAATLSSGAGSARAWPLAAGLDTDGVGITDVRPFAAGLLKAAGVTGGAAKADGFASAGCTADLAAPTACFAVAEVSCVG